jgi:hypothetical protein
MGMSTDPPPQQAPIRHFPPQGLSPATVVVLAVAGGVGRPRQAAAGDVDGKAIDQAGGDRRDLR